MLFFGLFSLLLPLLGLVVIAWAVLTIWRTVMLPRNTPREAACEKCKYPVAGLMGAAGFVCPECGSDLLTVGITTPRMEITRRGSLAAGLVAWPFLCVGGGYTASFIILMFASFSTSMSAVQSTTSWTQTLTPNTSLYQSIELTYESDWQSLASEMDIVLVTSGGTRHTLTLDPGPMTVVGREGGVAPWDADTIDAWFAEVGLDMADPQVAAAAAETSRVVDMTIMSPDGGYSLNLSQHTNMAVPTSGATTTTFATGNPLLDNVALWLVALALGVLVYGVGIVLIVVRRRRLVGRALATP